MSIESPLFVDSFSVSDPVAFLQPSLELEDNFDFSQLNAAEQSAINQQLQQRVHLAALINQINTAIRSTLNLDEILHTACRLLGEAVSCSRVSVLVMEGEDQPWMATRAEYRQSYVPSQLGVRIAIDCNSHLQTLLEQAGILAIARTADFPEIDRAMQEVLQTLEIRSMLAVVMRYQERTNGVLCLHQCDRDREWTPTEQELLETVGNQLAIAINQAQLYEATRRQAEREALLRLVTNQIRSSLNRDEILQTAVREVRQLLNTDRVVIYQFLENWQGEVVVEDVLSPWCSTLGDIGRDDCFSEKYAKQYAGGRVRAIHNIANAGLNECHMQFLQRLQVKANLIVPIVIGSELWGLLLAQECRGTRVWQAWETELLRQLGEQLAIAIQQAEFHAQVKTSAAQAKAQAEELQVTLQELQATQMQLLQQEKLSSLGQMVAGIAHEFNNAITFVHANLPYVESYATDLYQILDAYRSAYPQEKGAIAQLEDDLELEHIQEDLPKLLSSMREGTKRIQTFVTTLRNFSRLDEAEWKAVDLHEGIESTLLVIRHRLKPTLKIHRQYGQLPSVVCHAGQMNQVFLSILNNALDAIGEQGEVTLRSWQSGDDQITLSIQDTGPGIPLEIQDRIFDPFFTTKPVGSGSGLGLSLCYQIVVNNHSGKLSCISHPGQGTEFQIELPLTQDLNERNQEGAIAISP